MPILNSIPSTFDIQSLMKSAHVRRNGHDEVEFQALVEKAQEIGRPKAIYREAFIEDRQDDSIRIDGITFSSRMLRLNLDRVERVFAYVATCGQEIDQFVPPSDDILRQYWWEAIKAQLLNNASTSLMTHLCHRYALNSIASMNPGSGDADVWPIEQQKELFALLGDVENQIGVKLNASFLMIPNKSVSGIVFPTEVGFRSCQVCHREDCPSRSAPFDPMLWEQIQA